jgi:hypothetical protein
VDGATERFGMPKEHGLKWLDMAIATVASHEPL